MNQSEYQTELLSIFNLCALVRRLEIAAVLEQIQHAEAVGPIIDPTLYRMAHPPLHWHKKCAQAALRFQRTINELHESRHTFNIGGKAP